jgi:hypothetical protein
LTEPHIPVFPLLSAYLAAPEGSDSPPGLFLLNSGKKISDGNRHALIAKKAFRDNPETASASERISHLPLDRLHGCETGQGELAE